MFEDRCYACSEVSSALKDVVLQSEFVELDAKVCETCFPKYAVNWKLKEDGDRK